MKMIDPTYLRTIHDGLLSGNIHKVNASTLPIGLIGIYEDALPPASNVSERKKFLEFFAVWALLKKEVSAVFVVPLLEGWTEEQVLDYISKYSKWFNSPVSGKYVLYHERIRSFLLQKVSHGHFIACNESLIKKCQTALQAKSGEECEYYALEHLSLHLLIQAMESKDAAALKTLAYDTAHWNRQVEISKGFEWSKRLLNDMMLWASKYDDEEVIECALNKVDLHHQEQNDAPRIVELVAQNDIETALQRIEAFGGNDKEGIQRKFILYMLCLMELTLLDSKDKPFRKDAIEKLLKHLDENMPVDHSVLNWDDFFPSYLMFQMACEWAEMGLDFMIVYKRTDNWKKDWIKETASFTDIQIGVLLDCARSISDESDKIPTLATISTELAIQGKVEEAASVIEEALAFARDINSDRTKSSLLKDISAELAKQDKLEEALACALGISNDRAKSSALKDISTELAKQGRVDEAAAAMQEALTCARGISDDHRKSIALKDISTEMAKQCMAEEVAIVMQEALACAEGISDDYWKSLALKDITTELAKQEKISEALEYARSISDEDTKNHALQSISTELAKQGKILEALECARDISNDKHKSRALMNIANEHAKQGNTEEFKSVIQDSITYALAVNDENERSKALKDIVFVLAKNEKLEESLACSLDISDDFSRIIALEEIAVDIAKQGLLEESIIFAKNINSEIFKSSALRTIAIELAKKGQLEESLACIIDDWQKFRALMDIAAALSKNGQLEETAMLLQNSLDINRGIIDNWQKGIILNDIAVELCKQGQLKESLEWANNISDGILKNFALKDIAVELSKKGYTEESLACAEGIRDESEKSSALKEIAVELLKKGQLLEALACARNISDEVENSNALKEISVELFKKGQKELSATVIQEALACAHKISLNMPKSKALKEIAVELVKQGQMIASLACAKVISDDNWKNGAIEEIAVELSKQEKLEEALECAQSISDHFRKSSTLESIAVELSKLGLIEKSLAIARGITDESNKSSALKVIAVEMIKFDQIETSSTVMQESLAIARGLNNVRNKSSVLKGIAVELSIQGQSEEALFIARGLSDEIEKSSALKEIAIELVKRGNWSLAEKIIMEIPLIAERYSCWKGIVSSINNEIGRQKGLERMNKFQYQESKIFYVKGWSEELPFIEINDECFQHALPHLLSDPDSIAKVLQKYALRSVAFKNLLPNKLNRLNRTLDIQWAIDIKKSLSVN